MSAAMMTGAFVLPRVTDGNTDASTTRSSGSTTEPIAQVDLGW
ncbi:hypothetical protein ACFV3N_25945 [Streptomyces bauhiniae]